MTFKKLSWVMIAAMIVSAAMAGCAPEQAAAPEGTPTSEVVDDYVVKLGYYNCDHMTGACVAKDAGIFEELGINVEVTGNGKVPQAMAAGQMDVGYIGVTGLAKAQLKGAPIMIAAANHEGGSMYLVASNNIKEPKDLIGKKVGIPSDADVSDERWVNITGKLGIPSDPGQYQVTEFGSDKDKYLALKTGQIDGFICCDPWGSMAEFEGTGHILGGFDTVDGQWGCCCVYAVNVNFAKEHPELLKKMALAHTKAIEYIYLHPMKAAEIFSKNYNVPVEVALMTIYKKTVGEGRTLTWELNMDNVDMEFDYMKRLEMLPVEADAHKITDLSALEASSADSFAAFIKDKVEPVFPVGMPYDEWLAKVNEIDK